MLTVSSPPLTHLLRWYPPPPPEPTQMPPPQARPPPTSPVTIQGPRQAQTPLSCRIRDLLGPTNMGEISVIFGELVRMLKDLPPGGCDKAYAVRPPNAAASKSLSFMCDKQHFKDVVRLAELGARSADQAHNPGEVPPDPFVKTVPAGMRSLEAKVDQLALDTAKQLAPSITFADAAAGVKPQASQRAKQRTGAKGKQPTLSPSTTQGSTAHLSPALNRQAQVRRMSTEAGLLASRVLSAINNALQEQASVANHQAPLAVVQGISRNLFTGDIQIHLNSQESLKAILALKSDTWVAVLNPNLGLIRKVYRVIVHGVPTTFKPGSTPHLQSFLRENHGVLDTATRMAWANKHSIKTGKPFSSLIIHLTDPVAANQAIRNRICHKHMLKVTEKSIKRIKQCYTCLDFVHCAKTCSGSIRTCSHCAGLHHYQDCTKRADPIRCVNCTHHILETEFPDNLLATIKDMSESQTNLCRHSAFSNQCPLRQIQVAKNAHMIDYYETLPHE